MTHPHSMHTLLALTWSGNLEHVRSEYGCGNADKEGTDGAEMGMGFPRTYSHLTFPNSDNKDITRMYREWGNLREEREGWV